MAKMTEKRFMSPPREIDNPAHDRPILEWWEGVYDLAFIAFNPFFRLPYRSEYGVIETLEADERKWVAPKYENIQILENLGLDFDDLCKNQTETHRWESLHKRSCPEVSFQVFGRAVTSSATYGRRGSATVKLQQTIEQYCQLNGYWFPEDDVMSGALEPQVGAFLQALGVEEVTVYDEWRENAMIVRSADFASGNPSIFLQEAATLSGLYCVYARDVGVVMTWEFDGVEAIMGFSRQSVAIAPPEKFFEGFYADTKTCSADFFP